MSLKETYTNYFIGKGHKHLQSASLIPNNPTTLFTTAGVQPIIPYILGGKEPPEGKRLTSFQKCLRLTDIDSIGDNYHHTFFEMLGNWSLGDYFKNESMEMSFEFLTQVLGFDINRLAVSVFAGVDDIPRDIETEAKWLKLGIPQERIAFLGTDNNWWPTVTETGPCGPDTEIFYWRDEEHEPPKEFDPDDPRWVEIWNNVFIQYYRDEDMNLIELDKKYIDTGMGFERVTSILSKVDDNYKSPIFTPIINTIEKHSNKSYEDEINQRDMRIIADHIRSITMICSDDKQIFPSNKDRGYVLRRLIRRLSLSADRLGIDNFNEMIRELITEVENQFSKYYPQVTEEKERTISLIAGENQKFQNIIIQGKKKVNKAIEALRESNLDTMDPIVIFRLYETHGVPFDLTYSILKDNGIKYDSEEVDKLFENHRLQSKKQSEEKFGKGIEGKKLVKTNDTQK